MRCAIAILLLCCAAFATACPGQGGKSTAGATDNTAVGTTADTDSNGGTEAAAPDAATQQALSTAQRGLKLKGAWLGMSGEEYLALYPAGGELEAKIKWLSEGDVGIGNARPVGGKGQESHDASFSRGQLAHFVITDELNTEKYHQLTDVLTAAYGPPADSPPEFAAGHDFFKNFAKDRVNFAEVMFWSDPINRTLISATLWPNSNQMFFVLFSPEAYDSLNQRQIYAAPHGV